MEISEIKIGDKVKCLHCGEVSTVDKIESIPFGEFLRCHYCNHLTAVRFPSSIGKKEEQYNVVMRNAIVQGAAESILNTIDADMGCQAFEHTDKIRKQYGIPERHA